MKVVTPEQMNRIDRSCIEDFGIPGIVLMENAALRVVDEILRCLDNVRGKNIVLFAGKGNNGGDALAVARHLFNKGAAVRVFLLAEEAALTGDAATNYSILKAMGVPVELLLQGLQLEAVKAALGASELVIDGIFGTGLKRDVAGIAKQVIEAVNDSGKKVIAIDVPSGIHGESGRVLGTCVKADTTVTFGFPKLGLLVHPGCEYAGRLMVTDIGIPERAIDGIDINHEGIDEHQVSERIPKRFSNSNKGSYGKVFFVSGSRGMTGAGCLAGKAALRTGAGLVYLGVPGSLSAIYDTAVPETVTVPLEDHEKGVLSRECTGVLQAWMHKASVLAVGPGLSTHGDIVEIIRYILRNAKVPLVLDADALNAISSDIEMLKELKTDAVITPHPGEMCRLAGISVEDVQNNRIEVAREFSAKWKVTTVLKGAKTVVACPGGKVYINSNGNSGMAKAGTGDVLTGVVAGLIAQGAGVEAAAIAGVYLHGRAGDRVAQSKGEYGLIAGDLVEEIPFVLKEIMGSGGSR